MIRLFTHSQGKTHILTHKVVRTCLCSTFTLIITYKTHIKERGKWNLLTAFLTCNNVGVIPQPVFNQNVMHILGYHNYNKLCMSSAYLTIVVSQIRFTLTLNGNDLLSISEKQVRKQLAILRLYYKQLSHHYLF